MCPCLFIFSLGGCQSSSGFSTPSFCQILGYPELHFPQREPLHYKRSLHGDKTRRPMTVIWSSLTLEIDVLRWPIPPLWAVAEFQLGPRSLAPGSSTRVQWAERLQETSLISCSPCPRETQICCHQSCQSSGRGEVLRERGSQDLRGHQGPPTPWQGLPAGSWEIHAFCCFT